MSRKSLQLQLISLNQEIASIEARALTACYLSATDRPHEDMGSLFLQKDRLVEEKLRIKEQLSRPTFIQLITGGGKK